MGTRHLQSVITNEDERKILKNLAYNYVRDDHTDEITQAFNIDN